MIWGVLIVKKFLNRLNFPFFLRLVFFLLLTKNSFLIAKPGDATASNPAKIDLIPEGNQLVSVNFEKAPIKDIIKTVAAWTNKNIVLPSNINGYISIISTGEVTKLEAYQLFLEALKASNLTTIDTGKVTKIVSLHKAKTENVHIFNGNEWAPRTGEMITQLIPLKHIEAKSAIGSTGIATILQGMLDVQYTKVTAYTPTNSLIVTASGHDINRIIDVLKLLDVETQQRKVMIIPLRYSDPKTIVKKITLIEPSAQATSYSRYQRSANSFKILEDEKTNSVILFGVKKKLDKFKKLVKTFDQKPSDPANNATIHVRPLDYAKAEDLEKTLSKLLGHRNSSPTVSRNPLGKYSYSKRNLTPSADVLDKSVTISADTSTNSLIITGSRVAFNVLNTIIKKLDKRRKQVYIEADIIELTKSNGLTAEFSAFGGKGGENLKGILGFNAGSGASNLLASPILAADGNTKTQALKLIADTFKTGFKVGVLGESVKILGFDVSPSLLVNLLKNDENSKTLSSPQMLTLNNEEATQTTGQKVYYYTQKTDDKGNSEKTPQGEDVDLEFTVTPNVSYSDYITLNLDLNSNTIMKIDSTTGAPITAKRKAKQKVTIKNGQTVIISGLLSNEEYNSYNKIPLLGDIPLLGFFFRNTIERKEQKNLMIFVTAHVIYGPSDLAAIYDQKIKERDNFLKEIYGSVATKDDFYRLAPGPEAGQYKPTETDRIEEERQKEDHQENLKMMGYTKETNEDGEKKSSYKTTIEQDLPLSPSPVAPETPSNKIQSK